MRPKKFPFLVEMLVEKKILIQPGIISKPKSGYKSGYPYLNLWNDLLSRRQTMLTESQRRITGLNLKSKQGQLSAL